MKQLNKNNQTLKYDIVYKPIRHTYFKIKSDYILISTHRSVNQDIITRYLDTHFDKFMKKIENLNPHQNEGQIILKGQPYELVLKTGRFKYEITDQEVIVHTQSSGDLMTIKKRILALELKKTVEALNPMIQTVISRDGLELRPIKIKYLKSKFGSYHKKNDFITLNSFLATCDIELLIYVLYHEYAHVLVFNHSKNFYDQLQKWLPNHRVYQKRLKSIAIY
jgi:predicted metal-dependent hydrolase